jgi:hypothetical protein
MKPRKKHEIPLDKVPEKPRRGRPFRVNPSWVRGRADNYRWMFGQIWKDVWPGFSEAKTREDILRSFEGSASAYGNEFMLLADLILQVAQDKKFPKRRSEAQINFLADSIAAHGSVTPRSSRDICERERARIKRVHQIIRYEYWIECSCGYKGQSLNHACPKCEATISLIGESPLDASSLFQALSRNVRT